MSTLFEFLPLLLFLGTLFLKDIYTAVIVLMIAMPIGLAIKTIRSGALDRMYLWSTVFALVFGALTLYFRNPYFVYWKPTAFYWVLAIAFLLSGWIGEKPLAQRFFGLVEGLKLEKVSAGQWTKLNYIWVVFFVLAGLLNIYVAYNYSEKTWGTFKVFGLMALTFVFMLAQTLWIAAIIGDDDAEPEAIDRVAKIEALLTAAFAPEHLQVKDQSHLHEGHAGARDGRGHFDVTIVADAFAGQRPLTRHRMVYDALGPMMDTDIHALRIDARPPAQA